jgi:DNA-binding transcriptional MerR regulator
MFTESRLRQHPAVIKAFMGLPAEAFWALIAQVKKELPAYEQQRLQRAARRRAIGGGREFDQPLVIRVALVLTYLRLHIPQDAVAKLYGATQADVSRDLRRLLPVLQAALPCPAVWEQLAAGADLRAEQCLELEQLTDHRVLIDATEQRVSRPTDSLAQKEHYSGKKKLHAQDPTCDRWWVSYSRYQPRGTGPGAR